MAYRDSEVSFHADLERAPVVLLAGFEPDDESPIVFLGCCQGGPRAGTLTVYSIACRPARPLAAGSSGLLLPTVPGR